MRKVVYMLFIAMIVMAFSAGCISNRSSAKKSIEKITVSVPSASDIKRVEVSPSTAEAKVGHLMQFSARAYDSAITTSPAQRSRGDWKKKEDGRALAQPDYLLLITRAMS
jgi:hypothetical protein